MQEALRIEILQKSGLTRDQAAVYVALLDRASLTAREAALAAGISRTLGYAVLEQLMAKGLVTKNDPEGGSAVFSAESPQLLLAFAEEHKKNAERASEALKSILPELHSLHNLATGKPGIRYFEGEAGVQEALYDSLSSKETIYTYADMETVDGYAGDINEKYVRLRIKRGIHKKLLLPDTPAARAEIAQNTSEYTDMRLIPNQDAPPFHAAMEIYDGKISYMTFTKEILMATIITDPAIYSLHRFLFEEQWKKSLTKEDVTRA